MYKVLKYFLAIIILALILVSVYFFIAKNNPELIEKLKTFSPIREIENLHSRYFKKNSKLKNTKKLVFSWVALLKGSQISKLTPSQKKEASDELNNNFWRNHQKALNEGFNANDWKVQNNDSKVSQYNIETLEKYQAKLIKTLNNPEVSKTDRVLVERELAAVKQYKNKNYYIDVFGRKKNYFEKEEGTHLDSLVNLDSNNSLPLENIEKNDPVTERVLEPLLRQQSDKKVTPQLKDFNRSLETVDANYNVSFPLANDFIRFFFKDFLGEDSYRRLGNEGKVLDEKIKSYFINQRTRRKLLLAVTPSSIILTSVPYLYNSLTTSKSKSNIRYLTDKGLNMIVTNYDFLGGKLYDQYEYSEGLLIKSYHAVCNWLYSIWPWKGKDAAKLKSKDSKPSSYDSTLDWICNGDQDKDAQNSDADLNKYDAGLGTDIDLSRKNDIKDIFKQLTKEVNFQNRIEGYDSSFKKVPITLQKERVDIGVLTESKNKAHHKLQKREDSLTTAKDKLEKLKIRKEAAANSEKINSDKVAKAEALLSATNKRIHNEEVAQKIAQAKVATYEGLAEKAGSAMTVAQNAETSYRKKAIKEANKITKYEALTDGEKKKEAENALDARQKADAYYKAKVKELQIAQKKTQQAESSYKAKTDELQAKITTDTAKVAKKLQLKKTAQLKNSKAKAEYEQAESTKTATQKIETEYQTKKQNAEKILNTEIGIKAQAQRQLAATTNKVAQAKAELAAKKAELPLPNKKIAAKRAEISKEEDKLKGIIAKESRAQKLLAKANDDLSKKQEALTAAQNKQSNADSKLLTYKAQEQGIFITPSAAKQRELQDKLNEAQKRVDKAQAAKSAAKKVADTASAKKDQVNNLLAKERTYELGLERQLEVLEAEKHKKQNSVLAAQAELSIERGVLKLREATEAKVTSAEFNEKIKEARAKLDSEELKEAATLKAEAEAIKDLNAAQNKYSAAKSAASNAKKSYTDQANKVENERKNADQTETDYKSKLDGEKKLEASAKQKVAKAKAMKVIADRKAALNPGARHKAKQDKYLAQAKQAADAASNYKEQMNKYSSRKRNAAKAAAEAKSDQKIQKSNKISYQAQTDQTQRLQSKTKDALQDAETSYENQLKKEKEAEAAVSKAKSKYDSRLKKVEAAKTADNRHLTLYKGDNGHTTDLNLDNYIYYLDKHFLQVFKNKLGLEGCSDFDKAFRTTQDVKNISGLGLIQRIYLKDQNKIGQYRDYNPDTATYNSASKKDQNQAKAALSEIVAIKKDLYHNGGSNSKSAEPITSRKLLEEFLKLQSINDISERLTKETDFLKKHNLYNLIEHCDGLAAFADRATTEFLDEVRKEFLEKNSRPFNPDSLQFRHGFTYLVSAVLVFLVVVAISKLLKLDLFPQNKFEISAVEAEAQEKTSYLSSKRPNIDPTKARKLVVEGVEKKYQKKLQRAEYGFYSFFYTLTTFNCLAYFLHLYDDTYYLISGSEWKSLATNSAYGNPDIIVNYYLLIGNFFLSYVLAWISYYICYPFIVNYIAPFIYEATVQSEVIAIFYHQGHIPVETVIDNMDNRELLLQIAKNTTYNHPAYNNLTSYLLPPSTQFRDETNTAALNSGITPTPPAALGRPRVLNEREYLRHNPFFKRYGVYKQANRKALNPRDDYLTNDPLKLGPNSVSSLIQNPLSKAQNFLRGGLNDQNMLLFGQKNNLDVAKKVKKLYLSNAARDINVTTLTGKCIMALQIIPIVSFWVNYLSGNKVLIGPIEGLFGFKWLTMVIYSYGKESFLYLNNWAHSYMDNVFTTAVVCLFFVSFIYTSIIKRVYRMIKVFIWTSPNFYGFFKITAQNAVTNIVIKLITAGFVAVLYLTKMVKFFDISDSGYKGVLFILNQLDFLNYVWLIFGLLFGCCSFLPGAFNAFFTLYSRLSLGLYSLGDTRFALAQTYWRGILQRATANTSNLSAYRNSTEAAYVTSAKEGSFATTSQGVGYEIPASIRFFAVADRTFFRSIYYYIILLRRFFIIVINYATSFFLIIAVPLYIIMLGFGCWQKDKQSWQFLLKINSYSPSSDSSPSSSPGATLLLGGVSPGSSAPTGDSTNVTKDKSEVFLLTGTFVVWFCGYYPISSLVGYLKGQPINFNVINAWNQYRKSGKGFISLFWSYVEPRSFVYSKVKSYAAPEALDSLSLSGDLGDDDYAEKNDEDSNGNQNGDTGQSDSAKVLKKSSHTPPGPNNPPGPNTHTPGPNTLPPAPNPHPGPNNPPPNTHTPPPNPHPGPNNPPPNTHTPGPNTHTLPPNTHTPGPNTHPPGPNTHTPGPNNPPGPNTHPPGPNNPPPNTHPPGPNPHPAPDVDKPGNYSYDLKNFDHTIKVLLVLVLAYLLIYKLIAYCIEETKKASASSLVKAFLYLMVGSGLALGGTPPELIYGFLIFSIVVEILLQCLSLLVENNLAYLFAWTARLICRFTLYYPVQLYLGVVFAKGCDLTSSLMRDCFTLWFCLIIAREIYNVLLLAYKYFYWGSHEEPEGVYGPVEYEDCCDAFISGKKLRLFKKLICFCFVLIGFATEAWVLYKIYVVGNSTSSASTIAEFNYKLDKANIAHILKHKGLFLALKTQITNLVSISLSMMYSLGYATYRVALAREMYLRSQNEVSGFVFHYWFKSGKTTNIGGFWNSIENFNFSKFLKEHILTHLGYSKHDLKTPKFFWIFFVLRNLVATFLIKGVMQLGFCISGCIGNKLSGVKSKVESVKDDCMSTKCFNNMAKIKNWAANSCLKPCRNFIKRKTKKFSYDESIGTPVRESKVSLGVVAFVASIFYLPGIREFCLSRLETFLKFIKISALSNLIMTHPILCSILLIIVISCGKFLSRKLKKHKVRRKVLRLKKVRLNWKERLYGATPLDAETEKKKAADRIAGLMLGVASRKKHSAEKAKRRSELIQEETKRQKSSAKKTRFKNYFSRVCTGIGAFSRAGMEELRAPVSPPLHFSIGAIRGASRQPNRFTIFKEKVRNVCSVAAQTGWEEFDSKRKNQKLKEKEELKPEVLLAKARTRLVTKKEKDTYYAIHEGLVLQRNKALAAEEKKKEMQERSEEIKNKKEALSLATDFALGAKLAREKQAKLKEEEQKERDKIDKIEREERERIEREERKRESTEAYGTGKGYESTEASGTGKGYLYFLGEETDRDLKETELNEKLIQRLYNEEIELEEARKKVKEGEDANRTAWYTAKIEEHENLKRKVEQIQQNRKREAAIEEERRIQLEREQEEQKRMRREEREQKRKEREKLELARYEETEETLTDCEAKALKKKREKDEEKQRELAEAARNETEIKSEEVPQVPKERPSQVPEERPSQVPKERPSQVPEERPSQVPEERPSQVPEEIPSQVPEDNMQNCTSS